METYAILSHTLRAIADCIKYLLDEKGFKYVLPGKIHNDPIEMYFCKMRSMSGMNAALSVESFCQNSCSVLLRDVSSLSKNDNGTFNRIQYKSFFNDISEVTKLQEKGIADDLKVKLSILNTFSAIDQSHIY